MIMPDEASPTEPPTEPLIPPEQQEESACAKAIVSDVLDRSITRYMYGNLVILFLASFYWCTCIFPRLSLGYLECEV